GVANRYITDARVAIYRNTGGSGVVVPPFGVAASAPVRHVPAATSYLPGSVGDTLTLIHTPRVGQLVGEGYVGQRVTATTATDRAAGGGRTALAFGYHGGLLRAAYKALAV